MKNSLQLVTSMLSLQAGAHPDVAERLKEASSRIAAIARAHDRLYRSTQVQEIDVCEYLADICKDLGGMVPHCEVVCHSTEPIFLSTDRAIPIALLITELVTNAAKHAFPNRNDALIRIEMANRDGAWLCTVADNGIGATGPLQGTGSRILEGLARSIDARLQGEAGQGGTRVTIVMPTAA